MNALEAKLAVLRYRHGEEAAALALLAADIRESRELLPDGFGSRRLRAAFMSSKRLREYRKESRARSTSLA